MRSQLQSVLDDLPQIPRERLPELLGELEVLRTTALLRLSPPAVPPAQRDELLDVVAASERLGISKDRLYRRSSKYPFTRRDGRKLLFSANGIDAYIKSRR